MLCIFCSGIPLSHVNTAQTNIRDGASDIKTLLTFTLKLL